MCAPTSRLPSCCPSVGDTCRPCSGVGAVGCVVCLDSAQRDVLNAEEREENRNDLLSHDGNSDGGTRVEIITKDSGES